MAVLSHAGRSTSREGKYRTLKREGKFSGLEVNEPIGSGLAYRPKYRGIREQAAIGTFLDRLINL